MCRNETIRYILEKVPTFKKCELSHKSDGTLLDYQTRLQQAEVRNKVLSKYND